MFASMMNQIESSKYSPYKKDSPKNKDPTTLVPANKRDPSLEGGHSKKMVTCGLSNIGSSQQNSMNYSSMQNSSSTLIWTSRTSTTTSRCVSMRWLESNKTFFLVTSPSKYTLSLNNTSSHIVIALPVLVVLRPTTSLDAHRWCKWLMTPV